MLKVYPNIVLEFTQKKCGIKRNSLFIPHGQGVN
jgi:hypothetical protein